MLLIDDLLVSVFVERSTRGFSNQDDSSNERMSSVGIYERNERSRETTRVPGFFSRHFLISAGNQICPSVEGTGKQ